MEPKPYPRPRPSFLRRFLSGTGRLLRRAPVQVDRQDLAGGDGVDIVYYLSNMNPARFGVHIDELLEAAAWEMDRYGEYDFKYGKFVVELYGAPTRRGRIRREIREYIGNLRGTAAEAVYGESRQRPAELGGEGRSLSHKAEAILNMLETGSPGGWVSRQNPYKVLEMQISVRYYGPPQAVPRRVRRNMGLNV